MGVTTIPKHSAVGRQSLYKIDVQDVTSHSDTFCWIAKLVPKGRMQDFFKGGATLVYMQEWGGGPAWQRGKGPASDCKAT